MKIDGRITMLVSERGVDLEIHDEASSSIIVRGHLTVEQFAQAMGRLARTRMNKCEVFNTDKIGKKLEIETIEFPLDCSCCGEARKKLACEKVKKYCPEGWTVDLYFNSQNSFFTKKGVGYARTNIRRWVELE